MKTKLKILVWQMLTDSIPYNEFKDVEVLKKELSNCNYYSRLFRGIGYHC